MAITSIMVVDDNQTEHFLSEAIIEQYNSNIEIIHAYDGQEALDMLGDGRANPDIIFLDINMPGMGGLDFLREYKNSGLKHCAVVGMLSSSDLEEDKKIAMQYDFVWRYFVKPISVDDLRSLDEDLANRSATA